jgi:alpha-N-arabinofuranosidase
MKNVILLATVFALGITRAMFAREYHVSIRGDDTNDGAKSRPLKTISAAAMRAQPGDVITVHAGVYRECVAPPRGGISDKNRIVYQAAAGEKATLTGSEPVKGWQRVQEDTWKVTIPNAYFGSFNPYADVIHGDWFSGRGRQHHTGAIYLNGDWLAEAARLDDVLGASGKTALWYARVDDVEEGARASPGTSTPEGNTTIYAQFPGVDPNEQSVEMNVRRTVFTPEKTGIDYITVRGFDLRNAATPWAPPTAGQIGIVSAYWCKGWVIENNEISYSTCSGVALGKYRDQWDNRAGSAEGYVGTLRRALTNGWNKATVGSHIVRGNRIHHCEQAGVVGSLGCSFSTITGNDIHDIHVRRLYTGAEMAGIKFHGAIDVLISSNHIHGCGFFGIWLDWMGQGARVTGNLMHDNLRPDLFLEMQHGPVLIDNNLLLSRSQSLQFMSQGAAVCHNLIVGPIGNDRGDKRVTPYLKAHTTELAGMYASTDGDSGDHRFYNNLIVAPCNLRALDRSALPCFAAGNVFDKGSEPSKFDTDPLLKPDFDRGVQITRKADGWYLDLTLDPAWAREQPRKLVTTELLGKAKVPDLPFENIGGSRYVVGTDYFGRRRSASNPFPGPFEPPKGGKLTIKVWPL